MNDYTTLDAVADIAVIYGIVIVVSMAVALVIRGIVWALARAPARAPAAAPALPALPAAAEGVPPEHLVVIAAAVAAMFGGRRVVRIETPAGGRDWTAEARTVHHGSHAPRKT